MKFDDISFTERGGTKRPGLGLTMPGRYWVTRETFELAWNSVQAVVSSLERGKEYTAETLCGAERWKSHGFGKRIALGRCIKYFVDHEMLLLRVANPGKKGKRKYKQI